MALGHEVTVVGYAARVPGAGSANALWSLLRENRSAVGWITPDRFPTEAFYHPSPAQVGRSYTFAAGLIDDVWGFDASAFGMSPREAEQVDPQQRQLLEVTQDALAHAGIAPSTLSATTTGVYVGASSVDYGARFFADPSAADVHMMTGNTLSVIANRLSYHLDLHGPSFTVDTACSSSLVALSLAADAIRDGRIDTAIVGGVNLLLSPFSFIGFSRASMLSPTGRCRPFDADADGYVRAEGAIVLVLRSADAARQARNRIHGTLAGWGVGQDGRTTGLSLPSAESQRRLLEQVYRDFGLDPCELAFVEAHGTGTRVGDPVEADALGKALAQHRARPLPIGSVKSNIGHLEPASGLAGVLKTLLSLKHGYVPATLHQKAPNPDIPFGDLNLQVVDRNRALAERRGPSLAGVNSFGFGGTNAHVVLRGEDSIVTVAHVRGDATPPPLLLSAHAADVLPQVAQRFLEAWPQDRRMSADFISAAAHQRDALPHRAVIHGATPEALRHHVEVFATGQAHPSTLMDQAIGQDLPVAFVFAGNGSQWAGMGRASWQENRGFRESLKEIDELFGERFELSLVDLLFADDLTERLRQATYAQPLLLALQMATVRSLEMMGVTPQATLGHSVGEIAAAWCAGALTTEQAIDVVIARSRHQEIVRHSGTMAALMLGEREVRRFLDAAGLDQVDVAAINSWRSVTVSGPAGQIDAALEAAGSGRIGARRLDLDYPFHSHLVDPVRAPLLRDLEGLQPRVARKQFVSSVTGALASGEMLDAQYWWRNVREPVQFEAGLRWLADAGLRVLVEVGPRPILGSYLRDTLRAHGVRGAIIETLDEATEKDRGEALARTVARVAIAGGHLDKQRIFGPPPAQTIGLPSYPWRHGTYRVKPTSEASGIFRTAANPLIGVRPRLDAPEWFSNIDSVLFPWLEDHAVGDIAVFPAAGYVEVLMAAAREMYGEGALELRELDIVRPLAFDGATTFETAVRIAGETGIAEFLSRPRNGGLEWALHARGIIGRSPLATGHPKDLTETGQICVSQAKVYAAARELGFNYGEAFRRIRHVSFPHPKRAVAVLTSAPGVCVPGQTIDITGLDAAFHALFASEEAGVADMPMKRMLPIRFGRIRAFMPGTMAHYAVARTLRQSAGSIAADIELIDDAGRLVLAVDAVRLVEAPVAPPIDFQSLVYRASYVIADRPGRNAAVSIDSDALRYGASLVEAEASEEPQLLLEAGCLRAAWDVFHTRGTSTPDRRRNTETETGCDWPDYLRASLLWQLETKGLLQPIGEKLPSADQCTLPTVASIVRTLISRHSTMAAEAAALARISEILDNLVMGDATMIGALDGVHWRALEAASQQIAQLRMAVFGTLEAVLAASPADRLIRLLAIGADGVPALAKILDHLPQVEATVTDLDDARLEQTQAFLGEHVQRLSFRRWSELGSEKAFFDVAIAIDALSEVAASVDGLESLKKVLRPEATLVAAELAPNIFWDIVRATRRNWWRRSAHVDFPVGPLLSTSEWDDELRMAGFLPFESHLLPATAGIGVMLQARLGAAAITADRPRASVIRWEGMSLPAAADLKEFVEDISAVIDNKATDVPPQASNAAVAWTVEAGSAEAMAADTLADALAELANLCKSLAASSTRLWLIVFAGTGGSTLEGHPLWHALTAAMRVAQNEFPMLDIRCLGLSDSESATLSEAAREIIEPDREQEVLIRAGRRLVLRIKQGVSRADRSFWPASESWQLDSRTGTGRGPLIWAGKQRAVPGPGQVEIEVAATGLNFRDVMWNLGLLPEEALEDGYAGPKLGMECSGTICAVGEGVTHLAIGDRVMAFVSGGFTTHLLAPAFAVSLLPPGVSLEGGASLPVAYLTAYYALAHLAGLKQGETVLVHGGAGAVGLAALNIARLIGARVIATAGSDDKRALLRQLGADIVLNSRTLAFGDDIRSVTGGKGVDVVLNSLAGEAMIRSMDCLRPFGRFIELGKRDFYANTHVGLRPFRRNLSYFGVDVDQLLGEHQEVAKRLLAELMTLFTNGDLPVLPHRIFPGERIDEAFRLMQRSGHYGKIVVKPARNATGSVANGGRFPVRDDGMHLVVGGTSGFGLAAAEWLVSRGAKHIILASRAGILKPAAHDRVDRLRQAGATVDTVCLDAVDADGVQAILNGLVERGPIRGVMHAAMVLDDRLMEAMDRNALERVLAPKITGAVNLSRATSTLALDYFLLFSSATTLLGNPGQYNYVAANAFLEGLAHRLQASGVPCLAVAWGGIGDTGYLARNMSNNASLQKRFSSSLVSARTALDALDLAYDSHGKPTMATIALARIDWAMACRDLAVTKAPSFASVVPAIGLRPSASSAIDIGKLRALPIDEASDVLLEIVVEEIASVLRLHPNEVDCQRAVVDAGMDSLMMLELRRAVEEKLQVELPLMSLANGITPADISRRIATLIASDGQKINLAGGLAAMSASHLPNDVEAMTPDHRETAALVVLDRARRLEGPL